MPNWRLRTVSKLSSLTAPMRINTLPILPPTFCWSASARSRSEDAIMPASRSNSPNSRSRDAETAPALEDIRKPLLESVESQPPKEIHADGGGGILRQRSPVWPHPTEEHQPELLDRNRNRIQRDPRPDGFW